MDNSSSNPDQDISSGWEQIQVPTTVERDMTAIRESYLRDSLSFFPPSRNEGAQTIPPPDESEPVKESSSSSSSSTALSDDNSLLEEGLGSESERRGRVVNGVGKCLGLRLRIIGSELARIAGRVRYYAVCCVGGFWSFQVVTGVLAAVLVSMMYARVRRWRRRIEEENRNLIFMIKEKDQKISQLLLQLAKMNELLLVRRRVPVLRIR